MMWFVCGSAFIEDLEWELGLYIIWQCEVRVYVVGTQSDSLSLKWMCKMVIILCESVWGES